MEEIDQLLSRKAAVEKLLDGFERWLLFFGLLVVIGVAGESVYGFLTWWNTRKLRKVDESIEQYREREVTHANERIESLRSENLNLQERVLSLQDRVAWRSLGKTRSQFIEQLRRFSGQQFDMEGASADPEGEYFAADIRTALVSAGWNFNNIGAYIAGPRFNGVVVVANDSDPPAKMLIANLTAAGVKQLIQTSPEAARPLTPWVVPPKHIMILVGRKPYEEVR